MAIFKTLLFVILPLAFVLHLVQSNPVLIKDVVEIPPLQKIACAARCQLSSRPHLCKRACGTCCVRCDCVPPGTSGNYDVCPCYANMTTHGGRHKCP
ncbi:Gibberellin-regulated protein 1 precursor, putative [Ricinus communis]|uniref:Gibberellin-regulated protein 1, putative n=1 Tax=Ricinus communis TaxID=3988 RepID=B9R887_RICCO|nr:Gibberellin-regulated protein 1 precursor, putative [Ricinus communis]